MLAAAAGKYPGGDLEAHSQAFRNVPALIHRMPVVAATPPKRVTVPVSHMLLAPAKGAPSDG